MAVRPETSKQIAFFYLSCFQGELPQKTALQNVCFLLGPRLRPNLVIRIQKLDMPHYPSLNWKAPDTIVDVTLNRITPPYAAHGPLVLF
jgi:hypothetical protein